METPATYRLVVGTRSTPKHTFHDVWEERGGGIPATSCVTAVIFEFCFVYLIFADNLKIIPCMGYTRCWSYFFLCGIDEGKKVERMIDANSPLQMGIDLSNNLESSSLCFLYLFFLRLLRRPAFSYFHYF